MVNLGAEGKLQPQIPLKLFVPETNCCSRQGGNHRQTTGFCFPISFLFNLISAMWQRKLGLQGLVVGLFSSSGRPWPDQANCCSQFECSVEYLILHRILNTA